MARKKQYNEQVVIEKAMALFWRNGYENTSVRMLEKEMGINQFSIYASFGNKQGVFLESIKCYRKQIRQITDILENGKNGIKDIKDYFFNFLEFSKENACYKGCLVTNTVSELKSEENPLIMKELLFFSNEIKQLFVRSLKQNDYEEVLIDKKANFLMNSLLGLSIASKVYSTKELEEIIEMTFLNN
ncbi:MULTISPECIES: TetR/AcrR family transcriptional regulator [Polaribacter]|uniref:TetR/AcrR family transcriptional regulator n=1 Tax=Polaribacter marinaquae TaxID=1642819 RepID=A0ABZ2TND3_9FLAO|nr:TetR/AcrR family transcriptional regulator [Polaribacter sp. BM10]AQS94616.1 TetR family transcriptional regulator [Polaribacter sp. BM10]